MCVAIAFALFIFISLSLFLLENLYCSPNRTYFLARIFGSVSFFIFRPALLVWKRYTSYFFFGLSPSLFFSLPSTVLVVLEGNSRFIHSSNSISFALNKVTKSKLESRIKYLPTTTTKTTTRREKKSKRREREKKKRTRHL